MYHADFRALANSFIRRLTPYQPGKTIDAIKRECGQQTNLKLASNENLFGVSPRIQEAIHATLHQLHTYPDSHAYELKQLLAQFFKIQENQLTLGNGSENILELITKAYLQKGDNAVLSQYAFLTIANVILSQGATTRIAPASAWRHDAMNILNAINQKTRIVFIVNPNNPTGTYMTDSEFRLLMDNIPSHILVVVDEAYAEYVQANDYPDTLQYLATYPNLIITRTFSKAYGLAALRLGYAISSSTIADILNRARLPFNVNALALNAAMAALLDQAHLKQTLALTQASLKQLRDGLAHLGLNFIPSQGNFLSIEVSDAAAYYHELLYQGIIVRPLDAYAMPKHIRVTAAPSEQNDLFLAALQKISHKLPTNREG